MEKEVKLFDKRFVHYIWNDELEGKEVFASNDIYSLMDLVNNWRETEGLVKEYEYSNYPFITVKGNRLYQIAYYDPNYEAKWAYYKEGKTVQFKNCFGNWNDCDTPSWYDEYEYRVKPECPCEDGIDSKACVGCEHSEDGKQTVHPFKDCDELVEFWIKNYQTGFRPAYTKPLIWVRLKCDGRERLIVAFGKGFGTDFVEIGNKAKAVTLQKLFDDYEFLDGTPCGMEVKE